VKEFEDRLAAVARMQADLLELVHRSTLDVVAARKRLDERIEDLEAAERRIADQHRAAAAAGEEDADLLQDQSARTRQRVQELRADLDGLRGAEDLLTARAAQMQDQITDFRNTMELVSAKVVAARTSAVTAEALDTLRDALTYIELVVAEPGRRRAERSRVTIKPTPPPPANQPPTRAAGS
jgi:chromosome segregation ATPase